MIASPTVLRHSSKRNLSSMKTSDKERKVFIAPTRYAFHTDDADFDREVFIDAEQGIFTPGEDD